MPTRFFIRGARLLDLLFPAIALALLVVLLVAAYGVLVPFFAALAATPVALTLLSVAALTRTLAGDSPDRESA